jgi:hypothetical protein
MFMLEDALWAKVNGGPEGVLCLACVEERLGRSVTRDDLKLEVPCNAWLLV